MLGKESEISGVGGRHARRIARVCTLSLTSGPDSVEKITSLCTALTTVLHSQPAPIGKVPDLRCIIKGNKRYCISRKNVGLQRRHRVRAVAIITTITEKA